MRWIHCTFLSIILFLCIAASPFENMDRNNDGRLSHREFKGPGYAFSKLDSNHDGYISENEARNSKLMNDTGKNQQKTVISSGNTELKYIDTHSHLIGIYKKRKTEAYDFEGAALRALKSMKKCNVKINIIMPTPQTVEQEGLYTADNLLDSVQKYSDNFLFLAGGGSLNRIIQQTIEVGRVTEKDRVNFKKTADEWIKKGAAGFGEMATEHFSFNSRHPYVTAPPDHELFIMLSDIAADYNVPIDIHMEAIPEDMPMPAGFKSPPNPEVLKANIPKFNKLLDHNKKTKIIWDHLGWDNTGFRDPASTRDILKKHDNLYMSIRIATELHIKYTPEKSRLLDAKGKIKKEWLEVLNEFSDRFVIGSDEFFMTPKGRNSKHGSTGSMDNTTKFLMQLPQELSDKIGYLNAVKIFNIK